MPSYVTINDWLASNGGKIGLSGEKLQRVTTETSENTYTWSGVLTLASNPTDVLKMLIGNEYRICKIRKITIQLIADTAGTVPVLVSLMRRDGGDNPGGTSTYREFLKRDARNPASSVQLWTYDTNPTSLNNGYSMESKYANIGSNAAPAQPIVFDFTDGGRYPSLVSVNDGFFQKFFSINLGGASFGANPKMLFTVEISEEEPQKVVLWGDSLVSNASTLKQAINGYPGINNGASFHFLGNNGKRITDVLPTAAQNPAGLVYPMISTLRILPSYGMAAKQPILIQHGLTNDVRTGAVTLPQAIDLLCAWRYLVKNGCTSGQTWVSDHPQGAATSFTWNDTINKADARPHAKLIFWSPNSYLADDPTASSAILASGAFVGMTLAQRAQAASDIVRLAYDAMSIYSDCYIYHSQDYVSPTTGYSFGRTSIPLAQSKTMLDQLHPDDTGEALKSEQLVSILQEHGVL